MTGLTTIEKAAPKPLPRNTTQAQRKAAYVKRVEEMKRKAAAALNGETGKLPDLFARMGEAVAATIRRDYDVERAARNVAGTIKGLKDKSQEEVEALWSGFETDFRAAMLRSGKMGQESIDEMLSTVSRDVIRGAGLSKPHLAETLLLQDYSADLVAAVKAEVITKINQQIQLGVIGAKSPTDMIRAIESFIPVSRTRFAGIQRGPLVRAEAIVRMEMGRIYSVAQELRGQEYDAKGIDVRKVWHSSGLPAGRRRDGHYEMDGQARKIDEKFSNPETGSELAYPRDPAAPAEEWINCGCYMTITTAEQRDIF